MVEIPAFVVAALEQAGYESPYYKPVTDVFVGHWGDLELSTFVRALQEGEGTDRLLAIFVMTRNDTDQVRHLLLSFLQSAPLERWASALVLGKMKEERAIPSLMTMLTEFLPPHTQYCFLLSGQPASNEKPCGSVGRRRPVLESTADL